jgi:hypothetical protein
MDALGLSAAAKRKPKQRRRPPAHPRPGFWPDVLPSAILIPGMDGAQGCLSRQVAPVKIS